MTNILIILPFGLYFIPLLFLERSAAMWWGLPLAVWWMLGCIPLTSLCLLFAWRRSGRTADAERPSP